MAKRSVKKNGVFSKALINAVQTVCKEATENGETITREKVAAMIIKTRAFNQDNLPLLTMMVGEAVKHGEVAGYGSRRGPGNGIYRLGAGESEE